MTHRRWFAGTACLLAALIALPSPAAAASRHRKRKAKRPVPAAVKPRAVPPAEPPSEPEDASAGETESTEETAPAPATAPPVVPAASPRREVVSHAPDERASAESDVDGPLLARREAARLAAGRIEVAVSIGIDVGRRQFTYSDPIGSLARPYVLSAVPLATFGLETYPLASTGIPFLRDLGVRGRVSRAFGLDSSTNTGLPLDASWTRFTAEVRERLLVRGAHPLELGVAGGLDASYFEMSAKGDVGALVPSAETLSLRFGLDARLQVTRRFSLLIGGAYLMALSHGEIYDRFRRPRVAGADAEFCAAVGLVAGLEVRLNGRYTRYFASFDPEVGDAAVAGGALDEQMQLGLGLRYAH